MIWEMGHTSVFIAVRPWQVFFLLEHLHGSAFDNVGMEDCSGRSMTESMKRSSPPWQKTKCDGGKVNCSARIRSTSLFLDLIFVE
jgi:hypothetical protein